MKRDFSQVDILECAVQIRQLWRGEEPGLTKLVRPNRLVGVSLFGLTNLVRPRSSLRQS